MRRARIVLAAVGAVVFGGGPVGAQPLGTFSWQQFPYCNVVTVSVVQAGAIYHLDGFDTQCGAALRAAASGLPFPNPDGTIGLASPS